MHYSYLFYKHIVYSNSLINRLKYMTCFYDYVKRIFNMWSFAL